MLNLLFNWDKKLMKIQREIGLATFIKLNSHSYIILIRLK